MKKKEFIIKKATEFSIKEKKIFKQIVLSKGEVIENSFDTLLNKNPILLFYPNTKNIEAVGALKIPNESYKNKVFNNSKTKLSPKDFKYELGWIVSLIEKKGVGKYITQVLSNYELSIYSTVRYDNIGMNKILKSLNFKKVGNKYKSTRDDYYNVLYIKEN